MDKEAALYEVIADLTRRNEYLEREVIDLNSELKQLKSLLIASRAAIAELKEECNNL